MEIRNNLEIVQRRTGAVTWEYRGQVRKRTVGEGEGLIASNDCSQVNPGE